MIVDAAPIVNASVVMERNGWMLGIASSLDTASSKIGVS